jgi:hypothetical protein
MDTFWTILSNTRCPCGDQTHESFQSKGFASDTTSSQFQESVKLPINNISPSSEIVLLSI